jgi:hypothetical protein
MGPLVLAATLIGDRSGDEISFADQMLIVRTEKSSYPSQTFPPPEHDLSPDARHCTAMADNVVRYGWSNTST